MDGIWPFSSPVAMQAFGTIFVVVDIALRIAALLVVPYNRRPAAAMAWLLAIMVQPILGWILFSLLGNTRLPKSRQRKMDAIQGLIAEATAEIADAEDDNRKAPWFPGILEMNRRLTSMPHVAGNAAHISSHFDGHMEAMVEAVDAATKWVHVEFYLTVASDRTEPFYAALERARARGVTVRVLIDHLTAIRYPRHRETRDRLRAMGASVAYMMPLRPFKRQWQRPDLRNHRKLVVIDGTIGFTGSLNLVDPTYLLQKNLRRGLEWRDVWVRVDGPVARELDVLFLADWWAETNELIEQYTSDAEIAGELECSIVPSGPGFDGEANLRMFLELVHAATDRITIVSPYFVPDDAMQYAITSACLRGVHVELFASEVGDQFWTFHAQRSYYELLLRAGVHIQLYRSPIVLHSKFMTFDDDAAIVGSSNIDMRSFGLNFEVSMLVEGPEMVAALQRVAFDYREHSNELTLETWLERPRLTQMFDNVARLTSALQ